MHKASIYMQCLLFIFDYGCHKDPIKCNSQLSVCMTTSYDIPHFVYMMGDIWVSSSFGLTDLKAADAIANISS